MEDKNIKEVEGKIEGSILSSHAPKNNDSSLQNIIGDIREELLSKNKEELKSATPITNIEGTVIGEITPFDNYLTADETLDKTTIPKDNQMEEIIEDIIPEKREGAIVEGVIVDILGQNLLIDIGDKAEGLLSVDELKFTREMDKYHKGDKIEVFIERRRFDGAEPVLSRIKAKKILASSKIKKASLSKDYIEGVVEEVIKEGSIIDVDGIKGFCHKTQFSASGKIDLKSLLNKKLKFMVIEYQQSKNKLTLSHRAYLDNERDKAFEKFLKEKQVGDIIEGKIKNITNFGVFIELTPYFDGLVQRNDISWRSNPEKDIKSLSLGNKIKTVILNIEKESKKVKLGIKQLTPDPWLNIKQKYPPQSVVKGRVLNITDFGAFVELEPGVEGLIHISDLSWSKKIPKIKDIIKENQIIEVRVLELKEEEKKISLSLKHVSIDPWIIVAENYPVGSVVKGRITGITNFGMFVEIENDVEGLVPVEEISWTDASRNVLKKYHIGQIIETCVLTIDPKEKKIKLGIKQLKEDPFNILIKNYPEGSIIEGKVVRVINNGVFLSISENIDGFIPLNHIAEEKPDIAIKNIRIGEMIKTKVIKIYAAERKITLSVKEYLKVKELEEMKQYMKGTQGFSLGDILKDKLDNLIKDAATS
ncbi:MAG: S1 RNA-binding domain-containing protein [Candidatus Hydrogenedentota bacterium]